MIHVYACYSTIKRTTYDICNITDKSQKLNGKKRIPKGCTPYDLILYDILNKTKPWGLRLHDQLPGAGAGEGSMVGLVKIFYFLIVVVAT